MKHIFLGIVVMAAAGLAAFTTFSELPIGAGIPNVAAKMKDISGRQISLAEAKGKNGLLVMFSCNTCPYVIANQARTAAVCKYAKDSQIGVMLVNSNEGGRNGSDSYEAMKAYAKEQGYQWHYVVDEKSGLADAFGAVKTPESFLFNKDGKLVYHGAIDDNPSEADHVGRKHLKEAIDETLQGKEVSVKTSRSVGCGIKRVK